MSLLDVKNISCSVQDKTLLEDISFSIKSGELLVVVGRNGAGKSTLLKHLTSEMISKTGSIHIFNKNILEIEPKALARQRAVLPQSTQLNFSYKVLEVVLLGRIPHQRYQRESQSDFEIARLCLAQVGLSKYENREYLTLSGGEQQRVHLARALSQLHSDETIKEKLLFLDEPTSSLDIAHQHQVLKVVKELTASNVGVLAVLHDLNLASQYADRILVLADGQILALGNPKEVLTESILEKAFQYPVKVIEHPTGKFPLVISDISN